MTQDVYKVVPAPHQGRKAKGAKSTGDRFALALSDILNEMAADGWEFLRAETLPCDERKGLTGTQTTFQNLLVFRRGALAEGVAFAEQNEGVAAPLEGAEEVVQNVPPPPADDLREHEDADPLSAALGDTLRATREKDAPTSRRLGPADAD